MFSPPPVGAQALPAAPCQGGRGEADAQEVRARGALPSLHETALPLRRLHGPGLVSVLSDACMSGVACLI